jgi:hypothetical protein
MTHSGGKPHLVSGDTGQRYVVTFFNPNTNKRQVCGRSETIEGAQSLARMIEAHPAWQFPQIEDREATP